MSLEAGEHALTKEEVFQTRQSFSKLGLLGMSLKDSRNYYAISEPFASSLLLLIKQLKLDSHTKRIREQNRHSSSVSFFLEGKRPQFARILQKKIYFNGPDNKYYNVLQGTQTSNSFILRKRARQVLQFRERENVYVCVRERERETRFNLSWPHIKLYSL